MAQILISEAANGSGGTFEMNLPAPLELQDTEMILRASNNMHMESLKVGTKYTFVVRA